MAFIEVNHKVLRDVSTAIDTYCSVHVKEMNSADAEIKSLLSSGWLGMDAQEFGRIWEGVNGRDSISIKFRDSLKNFGGALAACANEYQKAQEDAYNAANRLPKIH